MESGVANPSDSLHFTIVEVVVSLRVLVELLEGVSNDNLLLGVDDDELVVGSES